MTFKKSRPLKDWDPAYISVSTKGNIKCVIVNTDLSFFAEGARSGLHDWWTRQLQCEKKKLVGFFVFFVCEESFNVKKTCWFF